MDCESVFSQLLVRNVFENSKVQTFGVLLDAVDQLQLPRLLLIGGEFRG